MIFTPKPGTASTLEPCRRAITTSCNSLTTACLACLGGAMARFHVFVLVAATILIGVTGLDKPTHQAGHARKPVFKMSLKYEKAHGFLMWVSMGLLMPIAILLIRMSKSAIKKSSTRKVKILFYLHIVLQTLALILATAGGIISLQKFNHKFRYTHQRLGLGLYIIVWLQPIVGFFRPQRGKKGRCIWYFVHWTLGTAGVILGIVNMYIGMRGYERMSSSSLRTLNILFSIEISILGAFYLIQDRWEYLLQQGTVICTKQPVAPSSVGNCEQQLTAFDVSNDINNPSPPV